MSREDVCESLILVQKRKQKPKDTIHKTTEGEKISREDVCESLILVGCRVSASRAPHHPVLVFVFWLDSVI